MTPRYNIIGQGHASVVETNVFSVTLEFIL